MAAVPKPRPRTPEQRKAERQQRSANTLKPAAKDKLQPMGLSQGKPKAERQPNSLKIYREPPPKKPLQRRTRLGAKGSLRNQSSALRRHSAKLGQRFMVVQSGVTWSAKKRKPLRLQSLSENARERRRLDAGWSQQVKDIWGGCIITGEDRPGRYQSHHCLDKSYAPEHRHALWNGIPLETFTIHPLADTYPEFHKALCAVADECRAAAEGRRPPISRAEAREIIWRMAPKMRAHARTEE